MKLRLLSEHHGEHTRRRFATPAEANRMRFWRRAVTGLIVGLTLGWYGAIELGLARQATRTADELEAREEHWAPHDSDDRFSECVEPLGAAPKYDFTHESKDCTEIRAGTRPHSTIDPSCASKLAAVRPYAERTLECAWPIPKAPSAWFGLRGDRSDQSYDRLQSLRVGATELVMAAHDAHDSTEVDHWCSRLIAFNVRLQHSCSLWTANGFKPALSICEHAAAESATETREAAIAASALAPDDADAVLDLLTLMRTSWFGGEVVSSRRERVAPRLREALANDHSSGMPLDDLRWLQRQRNFSRFSDLAVPHLGSPNLVDITLVDASSQSHSGTWWLDTFDGSPDPMLEKLLALSRSERAMLRSIARASSTEPLCQSD